MRFTPRLLVCLALSCLVCKCSSAVGKVTVDPNLGGVAPVLAAKSDPRLAQKVTYDAKYTSVQKILTDLTEMTGVKFLAGSGASDWPVRSRKMNILVKDVPLSSLMDSIARVMKFRWSIGDTTPRTYRLVVDKKAAAAADAMMKKAEEAREAAWRSKREEWVEAIDKYGLTPQSQFESLRESDPVIYRNGMYGAIKALGALFTELPEAQDRYLAGRGFRVSTSELSPETQGLLYSAGNEFWRYLQDIGMVHDNATGYPSNFKLAKSVDLVYYRLDQHDSFTPGLRWWGAERTTGVIGFVEGASGRTIVDLNSISDDWAKHKCARQVRLWEAHTMSIPWDKDIRAKLEDDLKKEEEALYPSEPLTQHEAFPKLEQSVKLRIEAPKAGQNPVLTVNSYIASFEKALADAAGLSVVSDSWVSIEGDMLPEQEQALGTLLDEFCKRFNYNWDKPAGILELRHRKAWRNRLNQVSDTRVTVWRDNTRKNGVLSLDDLAEIATLNYCQTEESLKADPVLGAIYDSIIENFDRDGNHFWLRLYSTLSPELRALLMGEGGVTGNGGVNGHMLTSEQWSLAQAVFDRIGSTRSDALFRMTEISSGRDVTYIFREIDTESSQVDRTWRVYLPKYTPPAAETDKQSAPK